MLIDISDVDIDTGLGVMRCRVFRPQDASRKWPALVLWAEIFGITGPIARSAQVFAGNGAVVLVPEFFHNFLAPGEALRYTPEDTAKGNAHKAAKELASYDADIAAAFAWCLACPHANGAVGTVGFCLGGGLAFRAALHPACRAAVCFYATDVHKGTLSKGGDDSLERVGEIKGEVVMVCVCLRALARIFTLSFLSPFLSLAHACPLSPPPRPATTYWRRAATAARTPTCLQRGATRCARRLQRQAPPTSFWRSMASTPLCATSPAPAGTTRSWRCRCTRWPFPSFRAAWAAAAAAAAAAQRLQQLAAPRNRPQARLLSRCPFTSPRRWRCEDVGGLRTCAVYIH